MGSTIRVAAMSAAAGRRVVGAGELLQRRAAGRQGLGRRLVGDHRQPVVRLGEDHVAEGVVEVLVGVDHRDDVADAEPAHVVQRRAALDLGGVGVDDQQAPVAADDADVDVEGLEAGHPAAVGDLHEAVVVGDVTRKVGHAGQATAGR